MRPTIDKIPLLKPGERLTHERIVELGKAICSDGCTKIPDFHLDCCIVHDLGYEYGIDPWGNAIDRADVDANFRTCMQAESPLGRFDPMSWWRWAGVRIFGRFFYTNKG